MRLRRMALLALATVLMGFACGVPVRAQAVVYDFGPAPGEIVEWPAVSDLFTGSPVALLPPAVVVVSKLSPCSMCEVPVSMAKSWSERYENVQVILVTKDTGDLEAVRAELGRLVNDDVTVVADDGRIAGSLGFNSQPIVYVISEDGRVRLRQTGFNPQRLIGLDRIVALANDGRWGEIDALVGRSGGQGARQVPEAWDLNARGGPVIAIIHSDDCIHCRRLADQGMVTILNDFARRHRSATFVILSEANALDFDRHIEALSQTYGERIRQVYEMAARDAPVAESAGESFAGEQFEENVRLLEFIPGTAEDPMYRFGAGVVPNILLFDEDGRYMGPDPYWLGPYDAGGLINFLQDVFLED